MNVDPLNLSQIANPLLSTANIKLALAMQRQAMLGHDKPHEETAVAPRPQLRWKLVGHKHHKGDGGHDIATMAYEGGEREAIAKLIQQEHHTCKCSACEAVRTTGKLPDGAKVERF